MGEGEAARAHSDLQRLDGLHLVEIDDADAVVLLVGDIGGSRGRGAAGEDRGQSDRRGKGSSGHV